MTPAEYCYLVMLGIQMFMLWRALDEIDKRFYKELEKQIDLIKALDLRLGMLNQELAETLLAIRPLPAELDRIARRAVNGEDADG